MEEYTFETEINPFPEKKWSTGRIILLVLAILLTIQVIPMVGYVLNLYFIMLIAILILAVVAWVFGAKEKRSIVGPVLAIAGAAVAIIRTIWFWLLLANTSSMMMSADLISDKTANQLVTWMMTGGIDWILFIVATVFCYIAVFKKPKVVEEITIETQF